MASEQFPVLREIFLFGVSRSREAKRNWRDLEVRSREAHRMLR